MSFKSRTVTRPGVSAVRKSGVPTCSWVKVKVKNPLCKKGEPLVTVPAPDALKDGGDRRVVYQRGLYGIIRVRPGTTGSEDTLRSRTRTKESSTMYWITL